MFLFNFLAVHPVDVKFTEWTKKIYILFNIYHLHCFKILQKKTSLNKEYLEKRNIFIDLLPQKYRTCNQIQMMCEVKRTWASCDCRSHSQRSRGSFSLAEWSFLTSVGPWVPGLRGPGTKNTRGEDCSETTGPQDKTRKMNKDQQL